MDGDGDGYTTADGDCDDTNPFVNPAAAEACRTPDADHDCDGILSQDDSDCVEDTSDPQTEDTGQTGEESNGLGMEDAERRAGKATCSTVGGESKLSWVVGSMLFIAARRRRS